MGKIKRIQLCGFLLLCIFSYAQAPPDAVARYYFNEGIAKNDLTSSPVKAIGVSYSEDRFGNPHSACYMRGHSKSYLNLGTSSALKPGAGTIAMWIKLAGERYTGSGIWTNPFLVTKNGPQDDFNETYVISYDLKTKKIMAGCSYSDTAQVNVFSNRKIEIDEWHHVVMTFNDSSLCLYVDGILNDCTSKGFRNRYMAADSVMIGNTANVKNNRFLLGYVDDISFYNRVLSTDEINGLYREPDPNTNRTILKYVFLCLLSLGIVYVIILLVIRKLKRELAKEKEKNKLQSQMYEMEMKVIKAQMNPHFIFNSMNSIQQFILENDNEKANTYLVKFSRLLRKILESNAEEHISVENEIDILNKYIEIESLRFGHSFSHEINMDGKLKGSAIRIPQMLIQPLVENAIWHGLLQKKDNKKIAIRFEYADNKHMVCTVDDNGVGRATAKSVNAIDKNKSFGLQFIRQRLELMEKEWGGNYSIEIIDKLNADGESNGTRIIATLPIITN
jgi:hypothetical protein